MKIPSAGPAAAALAAALALPLAAGSAGASTTTTGCADLHHACSLEELFDGASLAVDGLLFSAFELEHLRFSGGAAPDLALARVLGAAGPGLRFEGGGALAVGGADALDLWLSYQVSPLPGGSLGEAAMALDVLDPAGSGLLYVDQFLSGDAGTRVAANAVLLDPRWGFLRPFDSSGFSPQGSLAVLTRIHLSGDAAGGGLALGAFSQTFGPGGSGGPSAAPASLPMPEPAAPLLFAVNLLVLRAVRASPRGGAGRSPRPTPPRPARPARS